MIKKSPPSSGDFFWLMANSQSLYSAAIGDGVDVDELAFQELEIAAHGNHRGVVGGKVQRGQEEVLTVAARHIGGGIAQSGVGRHATRQHKILALGALQGLHHLVHQRFHDGILDGGRQVVDVLLYEVGIFLEAVADKIEE